MSSSTRRSRTWQILYSHYVQPEIKAFPPIKLNRTTSKTVAVKKLHQFWNWQLKSVFHLKTALKSVSSLKIRPQIVKLLQQVLSTSSAQKLGDFGLPHGRQNYDCCKIANNNQVSRKHLLIIYLQSECIEKYQIELCSKHDREHDFDVTLG